MDSNLPMIEDTSIFGIIKAWFKRLFHFGISNLLDNKEDYTVIEDQEIDETNLEIETITEDNKEAFDDSLKAVVDVEVKEDKHMIHFTKMEGLGNDYIYVDCTQKSDEEIEHISSLTKKMSDRHFGIGSDGLILICKSDVADFKMVMFNQDGSQAEMCGNGIRCVGKFVYDKGLTNKTGIKIETLAGIKYLQLHITDNKVEKVTVNMGEPIFIAEKIPVKLDSKSKRFPKKVVVKALDKEFELYCVSMGNPHAVTIVKDLDNFNVEKYGKIIEEDKHFPNKTNVEFAEIVDKTTIKMRVWERGAGETLACGTGACATAVVCLANSLVDPGEKIKLKLLGGDLDISWDKNVFMTGPATIAFEGEYDDKT